MINTKPGFLRGVVQSLSSWPPPPPKDIWPLGRIALPTKYFMQAKMRRSICREPLIVEKCVVYYWNKLNGPYLAVLSRISPRRTALRLHILGDVAWRQYLQVFLITLDTILKQLITLANSVNNVNTISGTGLWEALEEVKLNKNWIGDTHPTGFI